MQIQNDYSVIPRLTPTAPDEPSAAISPEQPKEASGQGSPDDRAILNEASILLSDPNVSASDKAKIMTLLSKGQDAATNGATGELDVLLNEIKRFEPDTGVKGSTSQKGTPESKTPSNTKGEAEVAYQDQSGDADVSFKSPVSMNQYEAPLAVLAHEGEHVNLAQARGLINDEEVTTYVSIHNGYDSKGRLVTTGGTTTTITHQKPGMEPVKMSDKLDITV
jgi:hypothetical protein